MTKSISEKSSYYVSSSNRKTFVMTNCFGVFKMINAVATSKYMTTFKKSLFLLCWLTNFTLLNSFLLLVIIPTSFILASQSKKSHVSARGSACCWQCKCYASTLVSAQNIGILSQQSLSSFADLCFCCKRSNRIFHALKQTRRRDQFSW